jgi:hypothetical protein
MATLADATLTADAGTFRSITPPSFGGSVGAVLAAYGGTFRSVPAAGASGAIGAKLVAFAGIWRIGTPWLGGDSTVSSAGRGVRITIT